MAPKARLVGATALLFPGQGSQKPGMGAPWVCTPSWEVIGRVERVLGRDVGALLLEADAATLQQTRHAQVAAFALGLVLLDAARAEGLAWGAVAGHSLGEYTAMVAAGVVTVEDAARLVGARADAMQASADASPGTMVAVLGLDAEQVQACCGADAWIANDNAPGQIVIAGTHAGVDAAGAAARDRGAKVITLAVGGAFHTPLMAAARQPLDDALAAVVFTDAAAGVVTNVDAEEHWEATDFRSLLAAQLCQPVRWRESVLRLSEIGITRVVELGAGAVLSGLVRRTAPGLSRVSVGIPEDLAAAAAATTVEPPGAGGPARAVEAPGAGGSVRARDVGQRR